MKAKQTTKSAKQLVCPRCGSKHVTKSGWLWVRGARRQRYQCQGCGRYWIPGSKIMGK